MAENRLDDVPDTEQPVPDPAERLRDSDAPGTLPLPGMRKDEERQDLDDDD